MLIIREYLLYLKDNHFLIYLQKIIADSYNHSYQKPCRCAAGHCLFRDSKQHQYTLNYIHHFHYGDFYNRQYHTIKFSKSFLYN